MTDPPIVARDGAVLIQGEALPLLYRATIALLARHRLDGIVSPTLLHTLRAELFRATTMSPRRQKDAGHTTGGPCSNGQGCSAWCSTGEAAVLLGVSRRTVQRMAADCGRDGLEVIRVGGAVVLRRAPVLALAARRKAAAE